MTEFKEVIDGPVSDIPLTSIQLGMLAAAEFRFYFDDLPEFQPTQPHRRPVLDTHVGTWVEHEDDQDGYAMLWETRPQRVNPTLFQIDATFVKTCRDPSDLKVVDKPKKFEMFSNLNERLSGERLSQDFENEELLFIQHIVRKNQKHKRKTDVPMDPYVVGALFGNLRRGSNRSRRRNRR